MRENQKRIQKLTLASMFTALAVMLASPIFSYMILLFGIPALRIDLIPIPIILAGLILGPFYGLSVGIIADVLGYLLFTHLFGAYHPGFTINLALTGLISGLMVYALRKHQIASKPILILNVVFLTLLLGVGMAYIISQDALIIQGVSYALTTGLKLFFVASMFFSYIVLMFSLWLAKKKMETTDIKIDVLLFSVIIIEILITLLTPLWVYQLYGAPPYVAGLFIRVIRAMWLIPIKVYFVYYIYRVSIKVVGHDILSAQAKKLAEKG